MENDFCDGGCNAVAVLDSSYVEPVPLAGVGGVPPLPDILYFRPLVGQMGCHVSGFGVGCRVALCLDIWGFVGGGLGDLGDTGYGVG